ncbi:MAG: DUF3365 domain-containing protein [Melioribacteraceae bacterium]|nr:DUF3365 domain-containing protein [Melioribacteraceae bacterium]MCF8263455.1 DUF3365 domain-containing protein [Melioribacteraceae bacterium]MCF8431000.1 DUF3365 domain-containing protein [Melioribacteraceae bacterium]
MKKLLGFCFAALFVMACADKQDLDDKTYETEKAQMEEIGNAVASEFMGNLKSELLTAIKKGGPENAISVCSEKAVPLAEMIPEYNNYNIEIKRTTFKNRNPGNAADEFEIEALNHFESLVTKGETNLKPYLQKLEPGVYNYYRPLKIFDMCLNCHGKEELLTEEVKTELYRLYPYDKAKGYESGDFRGVVRVKISKKI